METMMVNCPHCLGANEDRLWEGSRYRIVLVYQDGFPGWCRVVWNDHVAEFTDLSEEDRASFMRAVALVEEGLRAELKPEKINLASLGTAMPHLHMHIIPRFAGDPTFPDPVWLPPARTSDKVLSEGFAAAMRVRLAVLPDDR
jgi:diadenosine tetraphosphate (Ap4A) HIT family hydrolase